MARRNEYKKAKTCKHAIQLTEFGGLFVKNTCVNEHKLMLPCPNQMGIAVKRPYVMAKYCSGCKLYEDRRKTEKDRRKVRWNMTRNDPTGVRLNWLALWACVYGNVTITRALKCMGIRSCKTISQKDMQDLKHNKLSQSVGNKICEDYKTGNYTLREMAKRYKISYGSTYRIVKGTYKYESA